MTTLKMERNQESQSQSHKIGSGTGREKGKGEEDHYDSDKYFGTDWDSFDLPPDLLRGIYGYGYEKPSPIQQKSIKPLLMGKDVIAQAQSGTGKTAAFCTGALFHIDTTSNMTQAVLLSPTRELAAQTASVITALGSQMAGLKVKLLVGGSPVDADLSEMYDNIPHAIVGCPGRIFDVLRRNGINGKNVKLIFLDEADELLSLGFQEQVYKIFQYLKRDVQVALFSATLPAEIHGIAKKFMRDPVKVFVKAEQLTLEGIRQYYVAVEDDRSKYLTLRDLFSFMTLSQCIIYANSLKRVSDLYDAMQQDGFPVCCLHSGMDKTDRDAALAAFRSGKYRVLISSNVTARGIDVQQVSVVVNFDVPRCVHTYLHRIGRSGRWGRKGVGINLITRRDAEILKEIESFYDTQIAELPQNFATIL